MNRQPLQANTESMWRHVATLTASLTPEAFMFGLTRALTALSFTSFLATPSVAQEAHWTGTVKRVYSGGDGDFGSGPITVQARVTLDLVKHESGPGRYVYRVGSATITWTAAGGGECRRQVIPRTITKRLMPDSARARATGGTYGRFNIYSTSGGSVYAGMFLSELGEVRVKSQCPTSDHWSLSNPTVIHEHWLYTGPQNPGEIPRMPRVSGEEGVRRIVGSFSSSGATHTWSFTATDTLEKAAVAYQSANQHAGDSGCPDNSAADSLAILLDSAKKLMPELFAGAAKEPCGSDAVDATDR
jgi:hypothetical protein